MKYVKPPMWFFFFIIIFLLYVQLWKFTFRYYSTVSDYFWCSMCWVGKPSSPHVWAGESEIAYVSGNRCCSHIPRKRGLGLEKLLAIDSRDTPNTLTSLWGQILPRHTHSHTLTQKHSNMIAWWCSHTPAWPLGWTESIKKEWSRYVSR